jgi:HEAT repeat protein
MEARKNVKRLIKALGHQKDWSVRKGAAEALGRLGDARAVEPLVAALWNRDGSVRQAAAEALAKIGRPALEPLVAALRDSDAEVRRAAVEALHELGWQPDRGARGAAYWIACHDWERCVQIGAPAVEPLIAALADVAWDVRRAAAETLVALYSSGRLGSDQQARILQQRERITTPHTDRIYDRPIGDCFTTSTHADRGIGVSFPV